MLNGDLSPLQRKQVIKEFKEAKTQYLIATDLASRGISIEGINVIINYTIPINEKDYLHRAGRSIRNTNEEKKNNSSTIYNLCNILDEGYLRKYLLQLNNTPLTILKVTDSDIAVWKNYNGVKPRLNIEEKKREIRLKQINKDRKVDKSKRVDKNREINKNKKITKNKGEEKTYGKKKRRDQ
jgi:superfamily II DNA/RNA helicase